MPIVDDENLVLADSPDSADLLNAEFYTRFPYPWRALTFSYLENPYFETIMLNQDVGAWQCDLLPRNPRIWIAGCGTNQAILTALRFPLACVLGTDISAGSLDICSQTAKQLGISNLELKQESINEAGYKDEFDYIISTGVIHHNADPQATLQRIATALKPSGILELMVYNRFHWTIPAAFQKAVRILNRDETTIDFESGLSLAKTIIEEVSADTSIGVVARYREFSDAMLADELLQPILHSYTVESLTDMAESSGLEILLPCLNQFDKAEQKWSWNMEFENERLRELYESLPDVRRWQVTNLLLREASPQLWFYLQRKNAKRKRRSESEICEEFLATRFAKASTAQRIYIQSDDGRYRLLPGSVVYPSPAPDKSVRMIFDALDETRPLRKTFEQVGVEPNFSTVNKARMLLSTSVFPYVKAIAKPSP